jgi:capsular polysaccharide export protein
MRLGVPNPAMARLPGLAALLSPHELVLGQRACRRDQQLEALLAWGRKPSAAWAEAEARRRDLPLWRCEDGFLRSLGLGPEEPPLALVLDDTGIYYDSTAPSGLDRLVAADLDADGRRRAVALRKAWCAAGLSKYNGACDSPPPAEPYVLVVDQTAGDLSLRWGAGDTDAFAAALAAALADHPQHHVVVKQHPDVVVGRKRGHFTAAQLRHPRILTVADGGHPVALLAQAAAVYVVTSQMGFEALLWGRPVHCFGMPFYAGWGLTSDRRPAPPWRRGGADLEQLLHGALVGYSRYRDPVSGAPCGPERLIDHLALQRQHLLAVPPDLVAYGFRRWKRPVLRRYLRGPRGSRLRFRRLGAPAPVPGVTAVVWGRQRQLAAPTLHLEDGFLRSVGLGANLIEPLSWVVDRRGIYYDSSAPSDLEHFLAGHGFEPHERRRAQALRERIVAAGLTKYNLQAEPWRRPPRVEGRPVVLVPGQVPGDASIRYGVPADSPVRSNADLLAAVREAQPEAYVLYKPHPDVVAGLRHGGVGERHCPGLADEVLLHGAMDHLLGVVDGVHVLTSLTGFEALLRHRPVHVHGLPFYAGWGLTHDRLRCPRRGRGLQLDELVFGALIQYPIYVCRRSGDHIPPELALDQLLDWRSQPAQPLGLRRRLLRRWRPLQERLFGDRFPFRSR